MAISNSELALITATYDASKAITFESTQGGIEMFGFTQSSVMTNAQTHSRQIFEKLAVRQKADQAGIGGGAQPEPAAGRGPGRRDRTTRDDVRCNLVGRSFR